MYKARWSLIAFCAIAASLLAFKPAPKQKMSQAAPTEVLIAAAADLRYAMDSLIVLFSRQNPDITVKVTYGSSGNFFEQIKNGAPFDLFFSADIDYPRQLQKDNKTESDIHVYGIGQLVLWSMTLDPTREQMNSLLDHAVTKIAIANPAHAPYGKRAEECLHYYNLYDKVKDKFVIGENIAQTAQYAQTGAAEVGIIALSLALSPSMKQTGGHFWLIPPVSHQPLEQAFVLLPHSRGNAGAKNFADYLGSPEAMTILRTFGFGQTK